MFKRVLVLLVVWLLGLGSVYAVTGMDSFGLLVALLVFILQWLAYIPAFLQQTERFYDAMGSISFLIASAMLFGHLDAVRGEHWVLMSLVWFWAIRLGSFLFYRINKEGVDTRFNDIKPNALRFFVTWNIQGLWVVLTLLPLFAVLTSKKDVAFSAIFAVGVTIALMGLVIETVADHQKWQWKHTHKNASFITSGLWSYSRHPNYFGEILMWSGITIASLPWLSGLQWLALLSPIFVATLLIKVSGIPLLEEKAKKRWGALPAYKEYTSKTPILVPFIGKKSRQ